MNRLAWLLAIFATLIVSVATIHPAIAQEEPVHGETFRWGDLADGTHIEPETEFAAQLSAVTTDTAEVGEERFLTILCEVTGLNQYREYDQAFFEGQYVPLQEYWSTSSYNLMTVTGESTDWLTLPKSYGEYRSGQYGWEENGLLFAQDCTKAAQEAGYNLYQYSGFNMVTNGFNASAASGGFYCLDRCWRATWLPPWGWRDLSVVAHEMGHTFGWAHSVAADGHSYQNPFDVMSNTFLCRELDPTYGCLPQHTRGENRLQSGWIAEERHIRILIGEPVRTVTLDLVTAPATDNLPLLVEAVAWPRDSRQPATYQIEVREHLDRYDGQLPETGVVVHEYKSRTHGPAARLLETFGSGLQAGNPGDTYYVPGYVEICVGERAENGSITVTIATNGLRCGNSTQLWLPVIND